MRISLIGGGGRVGLPLAVLLAKQKHEVIIVDVDKDRVTKINNREFPFIELGMEDLFVQIPEENLIAYTDHKFIENSDVCVVIIGTGIDENGVPEAQHIKAILQNLSGYLTGVSMVILRSTVYPGITLEIEASLKNFSPNILVAFCPERITEGMALHEMLTLPQIIGVDSDEAFKLASSVFSGISPKIIRTSIMEAELIKLFANSYRYIKFAIANEFFNICLEKNIDWENVWNALKIDYPRAEDLPSPGFTAGPCLVKDTGQLNYFTNGTFLLGKSAIQINESLPDKLISKLKEMYLLDNMVIGILGMTFKQDIDDFRSSLSFRLRNLLIGKAKNVLCSDEMLQKDYFVSKEELIKRSDLIIVATPHTGYKNITTEKPILDIWRITKLRSII